MKLQAITHLAIGTLIQEIDEQNVSNYKNPVEKAYESHSWVNRSRYNLGELDGG